MSGYRLPRIEYGPTVATIAAGETIDWGLTYLNVPEHWRTTRGAGVCVAVLDTGTPDHPDLPTPAFSHSLVPREREDRHGHATHVAGIIGARRNESGVVGVAPECQLGYVQVLSASGSGRSEWIAAGIRLAIEEKRRLDMPMILNLSLGGGYDRDTEAACIEAVQEGCFLLCAAGNEGPGPNTIGYPAKLASSIAIAAFNRDGEISEFSSRGPEVDFCAPGEKITSTWLNRQYRELSGTSMATPAMAGVVALILAAHRDGPAATPIRNNADLREHLIRYSIDMGDPEFDPAAGYGRPDLSKLLESPVAEPSIPAGLIWMQPATAGDFILLGIRGQL